MTGPEAEVRPGPPVAGLLLAAGAGRRMGVPKAQLRDPLGVPYLDRAVGALFEGGCSSVTVVLGAEADAAAALLDEAGWNDDPDVLVVVAEDWAEGMGASLRRGLAALAEEAEGGAVAALVTLVDLPDVTAAVHARVLSVPAAEDTVARAAYDGEPGHPVLLGRSHWSALVAQAAGDRGARDYLAARQVRSVDCGDLATGRDLDVPTDL